MEIWPCPRKDGRPVNRRVVDADMVRDLNELTRKFVGQDILKESEPLNYDPAKIAECVREQFAPLFSSYGKLVAAFDCDLVFVSGKPSELPQIQQLLHEALPILPGRIQLAKGFEVGSWYPVTPPLARSPMQRQSRWSGLPFVRQ